MEEELQVQEREPALSFFLHLIIRPGRAFVALAERGTRGWLLVALFVLIFTITPIIVAAPITRQQIIENMQKMQVQMEQPPGGSSEGPAQPLPADVTQVVANPLFTVVIPAITVLVGTLVGWFIWAGVLHLLAVFMGGRSAFKTLFAAVVSASLPVGLRGFFQTVYIVTTHRLITNPGLSGLVPIGPPEQLSQPTGPGGLPNVGAVPLGRLLLHQFLAKVDLFLIWRLFLLGLAVWAVTRLSKRRAYALVVVVWLLFTLLSLLPMLISYSMFQGIAGMGG